MKTLQLGQMCCRNTAVKVVTEVSGPDAAIMVECMNAGLRDYWNALPENFKRRQMSRTLAAPVTSTGVTITADSDGENTILAGYTPPSVSPEGATCVLSSDSGKLNRMTWPVRILVPAKVATSQSLTVYGDCVRLGADVARLVGCLSLQETATVLSPLSWDLQPLLNQAPSTGEPKYWTLEPASAQFSGIADTDTAAGTVTASQAAHYLRFWPLPSVAYRVIFTAETALPQLTFEDLIAERQIAVHDAHAAGVIVPLIEAELAATSLFTGDRTDARARAQQAMARLGQLPQVPGPAFGTVGTPYGF